MTRAIHWAVALFLLFMAASSSAEVTRYAVIVGNNEGRPNETPLLYAQSDAQKVHSVLQSLGQFRSENMVLLEGRDPTEVQRVLIAVNARIRAESGTGGEAVLFVYYSGHADSEALHLGAEPLEVATLQKLVQGSHADFRILVLDACRSGALTRVKGARSVPSFALSLNKQLRGEGVVFLTSSAAGEDAQESDELRGSFFTHYFLSGLRGPADQDNNGSVSVEEAYLYAYQHTLRASSQTLYGVQHPTFHFDLKGKGAVPLTWISRHSPKRAWLHFPDKHSYLVFAGNEAGSVVAEVGRHDLRRTVALEQGTYFLRGRADGHLLEGELRLAGGQTHRVRAERLERVDYARLARKGGANRRQAHGPWAAYQWRSRLLSGAQACQGVRAGYRLDLPNISVRLDGGACRGRFRSPSLRGWADEYDLALQMTHVVDGPSLSWALGAQLGSSWFRQTFEAEGRAPARNTLGLNIGAVTTLSSQLPGGVLLLAETTLQVHRFEQRLADGNSGVTAQPTLRLMFGSSWQF